MKTIDQRQELLDRWKGNLPAQKRIREWCDKAAKAHFDEGNYHVRLLEDEFGMVFDTRNGYDWGNEPQKHNFND